MATRLRLVALCIGLWPMECKPPFNVGMPVVATGKAPVYAKGFRANARKP